MIQQKMPLVEVALECGFYDQSSFTKFFNKYYGISPYNYSKTTSKLHFSIAISYKILIF
ncbi:MAG: AraC family transcriptional regulator [Saprospiraceae bacterium]|nr:AraC family transcriptional regulator [Saprospiraceae bacterium]